MYFFKMLFLFLFVELMSLTVFAGGLATLGTRFSEGPYAHYTYPFKESGGKSSTPMVEGPRIGFYDFSHQPIPFLGYGYFSWLTFNYQAGVLLPSDGKPRAQAQVGFNFFINVVLSGEINSEGKTRGYLGLDFSVPF